MDEALIALIRAYQQYLSLDTGYLRHILATKERYCVMYPSCSEYAVLSIRKYGVIKGVSLSAVRIARCSPRRKVFVDMP